MQQANRTRKQVAGKRRSGGKVGGSVEVGTEVEHGELRIADFRLGIGELMYFCADKSKEDSSWNKKIS
jgi:hypothetical protein